MTPLLEIIVYFTMLTFVTVFWERFSATASGPPKGGRSAWVIAIT